MELRVRDLYQHQRPRTTVKTTTTAKQVSKSGEVKNTVISDEFTGYKH